MGLDMYIEARRNIGTPQEECIEKLYWRKFFGLQDMLIQKLDLEAHDGCIKNTLLTKEDAESILDYCCHNRDYFGEFSRIPDICEWIEQWDEWASQGWSFWYNANW